MNKDQMKATGGMLVAVALIPTPDDVTIISPAIQLLAGVTLLALGSIKKK